MLCLSQAKQHMNIFSKANPTSAFEHEEEFFYLHLIVFLYGWHANSQLFHALLTILISKVQQLKIIKYFCISKQQHGCSIITQSLQIELHNISIDFLINFTFHYIFNQKFSYCTIWTFLINPHSFTSIIRTGYHFLQILVK